MLNALIYTGLIILFLLSLSLIVVLWRRSRKYYKQIKKDLALQHLDGVKIGRHTFYVQIEPGKLKFERGMNYIIGLKDIHRRITNRDLHVIFKHLKGSFNHNQMTEVGAVIEKMDAYLQLKINEKLLFDLANNFIFIDDEPYNELSDKHTKLKKDIFSTSAKSRDFFFSSIWCLLHPLVNFKTIGDLKEYLEKPTTKIVTKELSEMIKTLEKSTSDL